MSEQDTTFENDHTSGTSYALMPGEPAAHPAPGRWDAPDNVTLSKAEYHALQAERIRLREANAVMLDLLVHMERWDHLEGSSDGPYWHNWILRALDAAQARSQEGR